MKHDLKVLRQAVRNFTTVDPKGMTINEMVDLLVDQMAEMRKEPDNAKALETILLKVCGTCNETFIEGDKGYRCTCIRYSTHSHQDYSLKQQVKMGTMREVPLSPLDVLVEIEKAFVVNGMLERKSIIKAVCKAMGKPYNKKHYLN